MSAHGGGGPGAGERDLLRELFRERAPRAGSSVLLRVRARAVLDYLAPDTLAPYRLTFTDINAGTWICWCGGWMAWSASRWWTMLKSRGWASVRSCDCSAAAGACGVAESGGCAGTENGASIRSDSVEPARCGASGTAGTMQVLSTIPSRAGEWGGAGHGV